MHITLSVWKQLCSSMNDADDWSVFATFNYQRHFTCFHYADVKQIKKISSLSLYLELTRCLFKTCININTILYLSSHLIYLIIHVIIVVFLPSTLQTELIPPSNFVRSCRQRFVLHIKYTGINLRDNPCVLKLLTKDVWLRVFICFAFVQHKERK